MTLTGGGLVVDCDSHVMEPPDLWERYLEPAYRDRAIRIERRDGVECLVMDGGELVLPPGTLPVLGGAHIEPRMRLFGGGMSYVESCPEASYEPAARAAMLDEWGVDRAVLLPTVGILWTTEDVGLASAYCRAYNSWLSDFAAAIPDRVIPIAHLNLQDPEGALAELRRCIDLGFKGVFVPPEPVGGRRPGHPAFEELWRLCAEHGLPLCLHVVVRTGEKNALSAWYGSKVEDLLADPTLNAGAMLFSFTLGAPIQTIPALTSMVADGLFDRVPDLKVVCIESGAGWAAYLMDRLDEKYEYFGWMRPLQRRPSDYLREQVWFVAEPEERTIAAQLDLVGEDHLLWGSDFPHIDSTLDAPKLIRGSVGDLPADRRRRVLGDNARLAFPI